LSVSRSNSVMFVSLTLFITAFLGICALFALKRWEESRGEQVVAPALRARLDASARHLKDLIEAGQKDLEKLLPTLMHVSRLSLHLAAVGFGHMAHWVGEQSHRLADLVSYKHRFERRELRSEFLKKVIRHKKDNGSDSLDTTA